MKARWSFVGVVILLVSLFMLSATGYLARAQEGEVVIGAEYPLSGFFAYYGKQQLIASNMAVEDINKAGGINGRKLRLQVYDTASKPEEAVNITRKLIEVDKVVAIVGPLLSSTARTAFPVANRAGVPIVASAASAPGIGADNRPWAFRNTILEEDTAIPPLLYYIQKHNIKTVSIIVDTKDAVSKSYGTITIPPLLQKHNIKVLDNVTFQTGDVDFSAHVTRIKQNNPDGIVLAALHNEAAAIAREVRRQNMKQPFLGPGPLTGEQFIKLGGSAVEGTIIGSGFWVDDPNPTIQAWVKRFKDLDPQHDTPHQVAVFKYETLMITKYCMEKYGVTNKPENLKSDREKIRDCWANLNDFPVMSSRVSINKDGDGKRPVLILTVDKGKFVKLN